MRARNHLGSDLQSKKKKKRPVAFTNGLVVAKPARAVISGSTVEALERPVLLFSSARSGSTLFYTILAHYFERTYGCLSLGEVFNCLACNIGEKSGTLHVVKFPPNYTGWALTKEQLIKVTDRRFSWIRESDGLYFIKVVASVPQRILDWLAVHYDWIFVERRNLFDQMLSYVVSCHTGAWNMPRKYEIPEGSLKANPKYVKYFEREWLKYMHWKSQMNPSRVLIYEDFYPGLNCHKVLESLGYHQEMDFTSIVLPEKQNTSDKLMLFNNKDVILRSYQNTELADFFPIPRDALTRHD